MAEYRGLIKAWSFSRWWTYETCPAQAGYKFVTKVPVKEEDDSPALVRGKQIHAEAEQYANGTLRSLPINLRLLEPEFKELRKLPGPSELQVAFTRAWGPAEWFDPRGITDDLKAWCRVIIDRLVPASKNKGTVRVIDVKTGKIRENSGYGEQLELYALTGLLMEPKAKEATGELWFTDHGKIIRPKNAKGEEIRFGRDKIPELKAKWESRVIPMLNDTKFAPKPNVGCRWCPYSKAKKGPCKF